MQVNHGDSGLSYTTVLGELVPMKSRFFAVGILFVGNIPVGGFGAAIGYAFQLYTPVGWRGVFWLTVGTNSAAALCWFRFYHPPTFHMKNANETRLHLIKNFDYIGTVLFIAGFILFFMSLSWGGSAYAWKSAQVISTLVIGSICLISLAVYEIYIPLKEPLIPVHLFKNRGWVVANLLLATGASVYYAGALLWPSMVAGIYATDSEMRTGWLSCLIGVSIALGELTGGLCAERIGRVKYQCIFFVTVGSTCLAGKPRILWRYK
jgi:MFS family permease